MRLALAGLAVWAWQACCAQAPTPAERAWADSVFTVVRDRRVLGSREGARLTDSIARIYLRAGDRCRAVHSRAFGARHIASIGLPDSAVHVLLQCSRGLPGHCPPEVAVAVLNNLTNVLLTLGDFAQVDSLAHDAYGRLGADATADLGMVRFNHGIALASMGRLDEAAELFSQVHATGLRSQRRDYIELGLLNLATIHAMREEWQLASAKFTQALASARLSANTEHQMSAYMNLGGIEQQLGRPALAEAYIDSALQLARRMGNRTSLADAMNNRAEFLELQARWRPAYLQLREYVQLRDSILNEERIRAVADVQERYESAEKESRIQQLRAANLDAELGRSQAQRTRNVYLFAGLGVLGLTVALWGRLRIVRRSRAEIRREKEISEGLLLNILPEEVADELKSTGKAEARVFETATILFTDFKGFTQVSEHLTPSELLAELNVCFAAFDRIVTARGIEKIKTIGDAYMCVGGLPDPRPGAPVDVLLAALEMQEFMEARRVQLESVGRPSFRMRAGVHTGPVVAGVVGERKFQYDIWGDAVNTAARMESSGEAGRVNISGATHALAMDAPDLAFIPRGRVSAKGKGELEMWFAERPRG